MRILHYKISKKCSEFRKLSQEFSLVTVKMQSVFGRAIFDFSVFLGKKSEKKWFVSNKILIFVELNNNMV